MHRQTGQRHHSTQLHRRVARCTSSISWPLTILSLLSASCPTSSLRLDSMPTCLLKQHVDVLASFLTALFNWLLSLGVMSPVFKAAYITPRLKKPDLDSADIRSFRPISNVTVLSKLLERQVAQQLLDHVRVHKLLPSSSLLIGHNTQLRRQSSKSCRTFWLCGDLSMLTLLDLSAAFDTVDHSILLRHLMTSHGVNGVVHMWITSYLANHTQYVLCPGSRSTPLPVLCGVPQVSVLGRYSFFYIQRIWYSWWNPLNCVHTYVLTTSRSTASVYPGTLTVYGNDETCCWLCRCHRWLDALQSTSAECIQDRSTVVHFSLSTKLATFQSIGCWLWSRVVCQTRARSWYFHWRCIADLAMRTQVTQTDMFEVFCCPSTTAKHMSISVKWRDAVAHRGTGVFQAWLWLCNSCRPSEATHGQASVCAERRCMADLQSFVVRTTFSHYCTDYTGFGCQNVFHSGWQR